MRCSPTPASSATRATSRAPGSPRTRGRPGAAAGFRELAARAQPARPRSGRATRRGAGRGEDRGTIRRPAGDRGGRCTGAGRGEARRLRRRGARHRRARHLAGREEPDPRLPPDRDRQQARRGARRRPPVQPPGGARRRRHGRRHRRSSSPIEAGLPVRIKDVAPRPLAAALAHASEPFEKQVKRGRLTPAEARARLNLLHPTLEDDGPRRVRPRDRGDRREARGQAAVFAELSQRASRRPPCWPPTPPRCRSTIGRTPAPASGGGHALLQSGRPHAAGGGGRRPAHGPLGVVRTVFAFARRLGKTPVWSARARASWSTGCSPSTPPRRSGCWTRATRSRIIDRAMSTGGCRWGRCVLADEVGIDVSAKVGQILHAGFRRSPGLPRLARAPARPGRLGVKSGAGSTATKVEGTGSRPGALRGDRPAAQGEDRADPEALAERLVLPMVNEAARCLEERIVGRSGSARSGDDLRHRLPALPRRSLPLGGELRARPGRRTPRGARTQRRPPPSPLRGPSPRAAAGGFDAL
jgi:3-hydroxyacyl-CoA dehydrogenase